MYLIELDGITYEQKGGAPFTLPGALAEVYGCRGVRILRTDGTVVVDRAGSSVELVHVPTGRRIIRRLTARARRAWIADMAARSVHRVTAHPAA